MASKIKADKEATRIDVPWLLVFLIILHVLFGLVALIWQAGRAWPIAVLWAGACAIVGAAIGFLFGIPRTLQGDHEIRRGTLVQSKRTSEIEDGRQERVS